MTETTEKRSKLLFRIYVIVVYALAIGLGTGWIAYDLGQNVLHLPLANFISETGNFFPVISLITVGYFVFALIVAGLAALVSIGTRDVFEVTALFLMGMLPRERKYWGVVFDQATGKPIPLVPIRVFSYSEGKGTLVAETLTDTDGRYRLHINSSGGDKYTIEIHYPGYQAVVTYIDQYLVIGNHELVSDIPLVEISGTATKVKTWLYFNRPRLFTTLFYSIYVIYLFILLGMIVLTINDPIFGNMLATVVFATTAVWNTRIIRARRKPLIGRVVDAEFKVPVAKAFVNVYNSDGEAIMALTDAEGVVKLNIPSGIYRSIVTAEGYVMLGRDSQGFRIVKVGKDGYLDKDVPLKKSAGAAIAAAAKVVVPAVTSAAATQPPPASPAVTAAGSLPNPFN